MLQEDFIIKILGIANGFVDKTEENGETIYICVSTLVSKQVCPSCGASCCGVHDYRTQKIKDIPLYGKQAFICLKKRRYICKRCNKRFMEKYNFLPRYAHCTQRLYAAVISEISKKITCKQVAENYYISSTTVMRLFNLVNHIDKPQLPVVLGIDEFKGNTGGEKYNCIITDILHKKVINILPDRKKSNLLAYFRQYTLEERKSVKIFVCDMWRDYKNIASIFPEAIIVADKYHWVRQIAWALNNVRKRVQKQFPKNKRLHYKRNKYILIKRQNQLGIEDNIVLRYMLNQNTDLYNAWQLKEMFYKFVDYEVHNEDDYEQAKKLLTEFILQAEDLNLPEFKDCLTMLHNWAKPILNGFKYPFTNAFTEGMNNNIKVIKRIAYGYRNFRNFRNRILSVYNAKTV